MIGDFRTARYSLCWHLKEALMSVTTFEDFVTKRNLWLLYIGHSWFVFWLHDMDVKRVDRKHIEKLPPTYLVEDEYRIISASELREYAEIVKVDETWLSEKLNQVVDPRGQTLLLSMRGWGA